MSTGRASAGARFALYWRRSNTRMHRRGHAAGSIILATVLAAAAIALAAGFLWQRADADRAALTLQAHAGARLAAQFGLDDALACLNGVSEGDCGGISGPGHLGEELALDGGLSYVTELSSAGDGRKSVRSTGRARTPDGDVTSVLQAEVRTGRIAAEAEGVLEVREREAEPILDSWKLVPGSVRGPAAP